jgi:hypothetical protein
MPQSLAELKASSPAYADMTDLDFAARIYRKHYADKMSFPEFAGKVGFDPYGDGSDPTEGMSTFDKLRAGFGKAGVDTVEGIGQLVGLVPESQVAERRKLDAPLMDTGAGLAGNVLGQTAQIAVPVPAGAAAKGASLLGRAAPYVGAAARSGLLSGAQGTVGDESRVGNAAVGGLLGVAGQGVASGASGIARGAVSRMEAPTRALAQKAESIGLHLGVPNLSENSLVRTVASQMDRLPFSGATKRAKGNQEAFNRAIGKTIGLPDAPKITPDVFATAKTNLQHEFERLATRNDLALDTGHVAQIKGLIDEATRLGGSDTARMVKGWANELISKVDANGAIPGKAYQSFDSRLAKQLKGGGESAHYLGQLRDLVRSAMDDSISASDRAAWKTVRRQYANLKTVEPLIGKAPDGNVSPQALMGRVTSDSAGKIRMATGKGGDVGDLARIGQRFLKASPNSGTADRLLVNAAVGGGLYGAQNQGYITPETALGIGGGLLANRIAGNALNSRALAMGDSAALTGLARLVRPAPQMLPAYGNASGLALLLQGGDVNAKRHSNTRKHRQK